MKRTRRRQCDSKEVEYEWFSDRGESGCFRPYLLQPLGVVLHGILQTLQLPLLPGRPLLLALTWLGVARIRLCLRRGVPLESVGDLEVF